MKYKIHVVSHSHWDREWYMSFEEHRNKLIRLIDDVLDEIKTNNDFDSFHLDGHTLLIDDYLEVRNSRVEEVRRAIKNKRLIIGPMYILNDSFLTSSESQIRNLQIGGNHQFTSGNYTKIGYCPDTFGICSQQAQIFKKFNINNMFFGRGVNATGFNNVSSNDYEVRHSEMQIEAPDGSKVLGILFANWYNNGWEIPTGRKEAQEFWTKKISDCAKTAKTKHLLLMNGCDHQPLQKDVINAINIAKELFPNYEFVHTSLEKYVEELEKDLDNDMDVISGELKSQNTKGNGTLVNTASSRINQKILNDKAQDLLTNYVEPLSMMLDLYDSEKINYGWKKLLENHPHDSICGCSCDSVHRSMDARFEDTLNFSSSVLKTIISDYFEPGVITDLKEPFVLVNTTSVEKEYHSFELQLDKVYIEDNQRDAFQAASLINQKFFSITEDGKNALNCDVEYNGVKFGFELPKDGFRKRYYYHSYNIKVVSKIKAYSYKTYGLINEVKAVEAMSFENEFLSFSVEDNGTLTLHNKKHNTTLGGLLEIYNQGDNGNEYMYGKVQGEENIKCMVVDINRYSEKTYSGVNVEYQIDIPESLDNEIFDIEKLSLRDYDKRSAQRSKKLVKQIITVDYRLKQNSKFIDVKINFKNIARDHRLRARFNLLKQIDHVYADSIFDIVNRPVETSSSWTHYSNDQQMSKFVIAKQGQCDLIIETNGINEYEAKKDYIDITLLRAVSEMGDWGYFETPEAQMLDVEVSHELSIGVLAKEEYNYNQLYTLNYNCISHQVKEGTLQNTQQFLNLELSHNAIVTSVKNNEMGQKIIRLFSLGDSSISSSHNLFMSDLTEKVKGALFDGKIKDREIVTLIID